MDPLSLLREALVLIHLVGFALLLGGWAVQAARRRYVTATLFRAGLGVMIASGLLLAIPFPAGVQLDYLKLGVKLVLAFAIGGMFGVVITREKVGKPTAAAFWSIGALAIVNAGIAVFWHGA
ncbi:membrane-bound acyltransferase YfiQ involved in biofilm formation [Microbacterium resistens]|uniref:Membrane-bound acyltransferase YfiQ involved in biofilm formation n=1 Tax=Microbacterium resistens TaxID=156977 RepID=A0ABU1SGQ4_9MICO|nr:Fe-S protein [Microbacterium resistens]MDR6868042.1 membrane-bound acyltransferase YfiQ involved in biofilm formation [Microbacterium resistens]